MEGSLTGRQVVNEGDSSLATALQEVAEENPCPIANENQTVSAKKAGPNSRNWSGDWSFWVSSSTYKDRNEEYKRQFTHLPDTEKLIADYACALQRDILLQGRLYLSENWLCFYSNIFRWETVVSIALKNITFMTKEKTARLIPNAIQIITEGEKAACRHPVFTFTAILMWRSLLQAWFLTGCCLASMCSLCTNPSPAGLMPHARTLTCPITPCQVTLHRNASHTLLVLWLSVLVITVSLCGNCPHPAQALTPQDKPPPPPQGPSQSTACTCSDSDSPLCTPPICSRTSPCVAFYPTPS